MTTIATPHDWPSAAGLLAPILRGGSRLRRNPAHRLPLSLLLVEDDVDDARIVRRHLEGSGRYDVTITECRDTAAFREALEKDRFDLWLLDYFLDGCSSLDLLSELGPELASQAPVLVLTGLDRQRVEDEAFAHGAVTCLGKEDVSSGALDGAIATALRQHRAEHEARRQLADLDAALKDRTKAMGNLAHEVGNLTNASRAASALRRQKLGDPIAEPANDYAELLDEYIEQLHRTTQSILGQATLVPVPDGARRHDLKALAGKAGRLCAPIFADTGRRVVVMGPGSDTTVYVDEVLLMQVLINLVSNAAKYAPDGSWVDVTMSLQDGDLRIAVTDEGVGLSASDLAELRARGARGAPRQAAGHGIGLSVVDEFLARMGGRLEIESQMGPGTRMTAIVPQP